MVSGCESGKGVTYMGSSMGKVERMTIECHGGTESGPKHPLGGNNSLEGCRGTMRRQHKAHAGTEKPLKGEGRLERRKFPMPGEVGLYQ